MLRVCDLRLTSRLRGVRVEFMARHVYPATGQLGPRLV
jgi:hypothetical protein